MTIRYFNVFGPRQDPSSPYSGVISVFAKALLENKAPTIYGDGEQTRDFTYVANVVDGVLRAVKAPDAAGQVVNVATGIEHFVEPVVCLNARVARQPRRRAYGPLRNGDVKDSLADITRARTLLGYEPLVSFEAGLKKTIDWYRSGAN